jgi:hypothetical protein
MEKGNGRSRGEEQIGEFGRFHSLLHHKDMLHLWRVNKAPSRGED